MSAGNEIMKAYVMANNNNVKNNMKKQSSAYLNDNGVIISNMCGNNGSSGM